MSIVVETGTGLASANAYMAAAEADSYFTDRPNTAWTGTSTVKEQAIMKATAYLDAHYRRAFKGIRLTVTQALEFPRYQVQDESGFYPATMNLCVPADLKAACAELAVRALSADLEPDLDRGGLMSSVRVGPVEQTFMPGAPGRKTYPFVDELLSRLTTFSAGGGARVVRF